MMASFRSKKKTNEASTDGLAEQARSFGLPTVERLVPEMLDPALVADLPVQWARERCVVPVRLAGRGVLLTADARRPEDLHHAEMVTGLDFDLAVAPESVICEAIDRVYARRRAPDAVIASDRGSADLAPEAEHVAGGDDLLDDAAAPVARLINGILLEAVERGASDVHFEPTPGALHVRYRLDGRLYDQRTPPKQMQAALISRLKVMSHMDIAERRLPQDGMAQVRVGNRSVDIRVSTVPIADGERVVLRLLNRAQAYLPLADLGMTDAVRSRFSALLSAPHGMILVCGPTGAGKTTTLYSALGMLDHEHRNIMTIEDPVEYRLPRIGQIQVKPKIGLTFSSGLRHILRQDPDVVLVGETRDPETAAIAVQASLTGHLVFTTLHTNDAPSAILRLVDMGVERYLVASCLRGAMAQRLIRCLCPECRQKRVWRAETAPRSAQCLAEWLEGKTVYDASGGCVACLDGYRGRSGLFELMTAGKPVENMLREGTLDAERLRRSAIDAGMQPLAADGAACILSGETSVAEVVGVIGG